MENEVKEEKEEKEVKAVEEEPKEEEKPKEHEVAKGEEEEKVKDVKEKEINNIYFIENHEIDYPFTLSFEKEYKEAKDLTIVKKENYQDEETNSKYQISIFNFKIIRKDFNKEQDTHEYRIKIDLLENGTFNTSIIIPSYDRDIYIYDFQIEYNKINKPPKTIDLPQIKQFELYLNYLRKGLNKKQESKENEDLILSTHDIIIGNNAKYQFSFYLLIFLECFKTKIIKEHLLAFQPDNISDLGEINETKKKLADNILRVYLAKPGKLFEKIEEKDKKEIAKRFYIVILYYYYKFHIEKVKEILENKEIRSYVYEGLANYHTLFKDINLTKEQKKYLIDESKTYNQLVNSLSYTDDIVEIFHLIKDNFDKFNKLYSGSEKEKENKSNKKDIKKKIDIESLIIPKIEDNMEEILTLYKELVKLQKKNAFILFKSTLVVQYISFFDGINLENLYLIKNLIKVLKEKNSKFETKNKDLDIIIHNTGLKLAFDKKLTNMEILKFIKNDNYYNSKTYGSNKENRPLDILKCINIHLIDDTFIKEWKTIDWKNIFSSQYDEFSQLVLDSIQELNNFDILLKLFDKNDDDSQRDYEKETLLVLQDKLLDIIKNNKNKRDQSNTTEKDLIELIYNSDQKKADVVKFLKEKLHKELNHELINKIYINLISLYADKISKKLKEFIIDFFTRDPRNENPETLVYLIRECPYLRNDIFNNLEKFYIQKKDFWEVEESQNLILFNDLLTEGYFASEESNKYRENSKEVISSIKDDIEMKKIKYEEINAFFVSGKKDELLKRLNILYSNNNEQVETIIGDFEKSINEINKTLDDLKLIYEDLSAFLNTTEKATIEKTNQIIEKIQKCDLNTYENFLKNDCEEIIKEYKSKAEERNIKKKSLFFMVIYKKNKEINKDDEKKCIQDTENSFNKLINIFNESIKSLDKELLQICLNTIKGRKKVEIDNEINILITIFEKEITREYKKEDIIDCMITLSRKEDVYNIALAILLFIEKTGVEQTEFFETVNSIRLILEDEKSNDDKIINNAISNLKKNSINIDLLYDDNFKGDNYLSILLTLKEQPEALKFLLKEKIDEDCRNLQELVGGLDEGFLNANDIIGLEKCIEFMKRIGNENTIKNKKDSEVITSFIREVNNYNKIELLFQNYINNYSEIQNVFRYKLDKSEASKQKISLILKKSNFFLRNIKEKSFEGVYYEKTDKENKEIHINLDSLLELRDRA